MYFERNFRLMLYGPQLCNILSKPVEENEFEELQWLQEYMFSVVLKCDGVGLAAPQIGLFRQVVIFERSYKKWGSLVNPEVLRLYGKELEGWEGCLSLPPSGNECMVPRMERIDVEASTIEEPRIRKKFKFQGSAARIVQHELDHLTGTFFIDRVSEKRKQEVLDRFKGWKQMRLAQIRVRRENGNVDAGFVAASRGNARLS